MLIKIKSMKVILNLIYLISVFGFSQKLSSELLQNTNFNSKELTHYLNKSQDSIVLKSEFPIYKVEIFRSNYKKEYETYKKNVTLPLHDIPLGRFTVSVTTNRKIITITLLRHKTYDKNNYELENKVNNKNVLTPKKQTIEGYWMIDEVNYRVGKNKIERVISYRFMLYKIKKNKYDLQSVTGKFNRLTIYEIYNIRNFIKSNKTLFLNPKPIYKSGD